MTMSAESNLLQEITEKAKKLQKHIVLPDALDERSIFAAQKLNSDGIARVSLIGDNGKILGKIKSLGMTGEGFTIVDPGTSNFREQFTEIFFELRKEKGLSKDEAAKIIINPLYFGALMVREGLADGSVAGSLSTTGDVLRAAIQAIGLAEGIKVVSSFFLMIFPETVYSFADCAVVPEPDANQLTDIALSTAENHRKLTGDISRVAMLSFSTKGSASHPMVEKVQQATESIKRRKPDLLIDGELQFDTAVVPAVAERKAPGSPIGGNANVLIFPDLNAGNIGYKMAQRLAGAQAIGPIVQGLRKPAFDLSRGCSVDDIYYVTAINAVMGS
jgi:phosphate acetyltransferase